MTRVCSILTGVLLVGSVAGAHQPASIPLWPGGAPGSEGEAHHSRAKEWKIDPARVGALGFSADGELVNQISARGGSGHAESADAIERARARPDFQALTYPGRSSDIQPTKDSPPVFLACALLKQS